MLTCSCPTVFRPDVRYKTHPGVIAFSATEYVMGDLKPATQYVVGLAAVNEAGRGPFSPNSPPVTTLPAGNTHLTDGLLSGCHNRPH